MPAGSGCDGHRTIPRHRTLNAGPPASSALVMRGTRRCRHEAAGTAPRGQRVAAPAAGAPEPEPGDPAARKPDRRPFRTAS